MATLNYDKQNNSHSHYEFFREHFIVRAEAVWAMRQYPAHAK
jgi:hypothetical protein